MQTRYVVTGIGPIDRHAPGEDVTGLYRGVRLVRLVDEGYLAAKEPDTQPDGDTATEEEGAEDE